MRVRELSRHGRLGVSQLVRSANAGVDLAGTGWTRMSGWIAWRQMPPELVMGSSLLMGHHQSLSRLQALVPHRQGTSLAAKMVCGPGRRLSRQLAAW